MRSSWKEKGLRAELGSLMQCLRVFCAEKAFLMILTLIFFKGRKVANSSHAVSLR